MSFVSGLMFGAAICVPVGALAGAWIASKSWRRLRVTNTPSALAWSG